MKRLTCEMCGSTDLIKQDGVFVCQSCGCKYSVEEARKMMVEVEGTVEVIGTVQIDNSASVEKYLANARRAKEKEDWEETEKYYNLVKQNDPENIEANFYSAYGKAKSTLISDDNFKREAAFQVLSNFISLIDDHYEVERAEENKAAIMSIAADLGKMINSSFVYTKTTNGYGVTTTDVEDTYGLFRHMIMAFTDAMTNIMKIDSSPFLHIAAIRFCDIAMNTPWLQPGYNNLVQSHIKALRTEAEAHQEAHREAVRNAYWAEHKEEKERLEAEKIELAKKVADLQKEMDALNPQAKSEEMTSQIYELVMQKNALGLFKSKEKQALQDKIDEVKTQKEAMRAKAAEEMKPIKAKMEPLKKRLDEVVSRLEYPQDEV